MYFSDICHYLVLSILSSDFMLLCEHYFFLNPWTFVTVSGMCVSRAYQWSLWALVPLRAHAGVEPVKGPMPTSTIYSSCFPSLSTRAFWPLLPLQPVGLAISLTLTCSPDCTSGLSSVVAVGPPDCVWLWEATRALTYAYTGRGLVSILSRNWKYYSPC